MGAGMFQIGSVTIDPANAAADSARSIQSGPGCGLSSRVRARFWPDFSNPAARYLTHTVCGNCGVCQLAGMGRRDRFASMVW